MARSSDAERRNLSARPGAVSARPTARFRALARSARPGDLDRPSGPLEAGLDRGLERFARQSASASGLAAPGAWPGGRPVVPVDRVQQLRPALGRRARPRRAASPTISWPMARWPSRRPSSVSSKVAPSRKARAWPRSCTRAAASSRSASSRGCHWVSVCTTDATPDRVLHQPAAVGVVAASGCRASRARPAASSSSPVERVEQPRAAPGSADLVGQVQHEAEQLVRVAVAARQQVLGRDLVGRRAQVAAPPRSAAGRRAR